MVTTQCLLCEGTTFTDYGAGLVKCSSCHLVVAAGIPKDANLAKLYQEDYFFGQEYFDYEADRPALEVNFRRHIARLSGLFTPTSRVVEVGCAYGYFLNLIKDRVAWHKGYDVSEDGITFAREGLGVNARNADFLTEPMAAGSVDTVVMWDVIEHVPRPREFLSRAAEVLKPGGSLVLTTGDISARIARWRGSKWRPIHPPTHIHYFDPRTLTDMIARYGLRETSVTHQGASRNAGSGLNPC